MGTKKPTKPKPSIQPELIDQLLDGCSDSGDLLGPEGLLKQLTGALVERMLGGELDAHLGYDKHGRRPRGTSNARNGTTPKTLRTEHGDVPIRVPRDRDGSFEPQLVKKNETHFDAFDDKIISLYARGMSVREIQGHLLDLYGTEVSRDLISRATDQVLEEVQAWQNRPLAEVWPILYLDGLVVKVRDGGTVMNKTVYLALGVDTTGRREVLGIWLAKSEGAKFWSSILSELRHRGVRDVFITCVDGLKGFPEAIEAVFPQTTVQTCIVHLLRSSVRFVASRERTAICADLKLVYTAPSIDAARTALTAFEKKWSDRYPMIGRSWHQNWDYVVPFLGFPPELRRVIYTTNAIESLNRGIRKVIKTRGHFPTERAAVKLIFLAIQKIEKDWPRRVAAWPLVLNQLLLHFGQRMKIQED